ncbi:MAG: exopolyphosphatase [Steroidobacteraceae bacterium]|nr:exopolyphosphatase [Steroidobacteraceae bacterium]MCC7198990.1 exopolyphosphatase [Gammaproteobacteria bacterium]
MAAVDLGSNSFHMIVARYVQGRLVVVDRLREMVRLAAGLGADGRLSREAMARAVACLERFGQRLRDVKASGVRVVGTNALRKAHRKQDFLVRARAALGHPIEIISGIEEARLIYKGVAQTMPSERGRRLVVDIGGGSTELIIGEGQQPRHLESLYMGCVSQSQEYFSGGRFSMKRLRRAGVAARQELESIENSYRRIGWEHAIGSSGSVHAVFDAIQELDPAATGITREGLDALIERLAAAGSVRRAGLQSISPERALVFAGGLAILNEVFDALDLEHMRVADGALREGLLYDMIGRFTAEDVRVRTVRAMEMRFHVDEAQASRVETTAVSLLRQVASHWDLDEPEAELALRWAARLHEIGLDVSHSQYHKHGAYLLEHADLPGFAREEQRLLAFLVGGHRRKLVVGRAQELVPPWDGRAPRLALLLRLAFLLNRARSGRAQPALRLSVRGRQLLLRFPRGWLRAHPLTVADLEQEAEYLKGSLYTLRASG